MKNFDKREILEVCDLLGVVLEEHPYSDKPYWNGLCPIHDEKKPSFVVFPKTQRAICYSCGFEGDVLDLVMAVNNCNFKQALEIAALEITDEEAFRRTLNKSKIVDVDVELLERRAATIFDAPRRFDFSNAQSVLRKFDNLLWDERYMEADKHLRAHGL